MPTFTKAERLCSKVLIDEVMESRNTFTSPPFRIYWKRIATAGAPVQVMISVPKRIHKRAVDRNRAKRLIREAYRHQKQLLYDVLDEQKIALVLIYTSKTIITYQEMNERITEALQRLVRQTREK